MYAYTGTYTHNRHIHCTTMCMDIQVHCWHAQRFDVTRLISWWRGVGQKGIRGVNTKIKPLLGKDTMLNGAKSVYRKHLLSGRAVDVTTEQTASCRTRIAHYPKQHSNCQLHPQWLPTDTPTKMMAYSLLTRSTTPLTTELVPLAIKDSHTAHRHVHS